MIHVIREGNLRQRLTEVVDAVLISDCYTTHLICSEWVGKRPGGS